MCVPVRPGGAAGRAGARRLIATPCLAPAPIFYLRAAEIRAALGHVSRSGDWDPYFERMGAVLTTALHWLEKAGGPDLLSWDPGLRRDDEKGGTLPSPVD